MADTKRASRSRPLKPSYRIFALVGLSYAKTSTRRLTSSMLTLPGFRVIFTLSAPTGHRDWRTTRFGFKNRIDSIHLYPVVTVIEKCEAPVNIFAAPKMGLDRMAAVLRGACGLVGGSAAVAPTPSPASGDVAAVAACASCDASI